jgi:nitrosocyanin
MQDTTMENTTQTGGNSNKMMPVLVLGAVVIVGLLGVMMMKGKSKTADDNMKTDVTQETNSVAPEASTAPADQTSPAADTQTNNDVKVINVEAGSFYYKPNVISVKKGEKVKIVMTSKDMMHDFNIDELNVKLPITKSGETNSVEFVANKVGTFEYYCSVGQHRAHGQVGKITVTE